MQGTKTEKRRIAGEVDLIGIPARPAGDRIGTIDANCCDHILPRMRTVVIGGYGNFGARICSALGVDPGIEIMPAGRQPDPAALAPQFRPVVLDINSPEFATTLAKLAPELVIHCAGPFQGQDYRVARAAAGARAHYIDLADGRAFVNDFSGEMDALARHANVLMVSGASTLPALSSAVIDELLPRFRQIATIRMFIAPGQRAPRGAATLAGVFSYAGRPFKWMQDGQWTNAWGWQELTRIGLPGLGGRWAAACDVPDLGLFPARYPGVSTVEFRAALELGVQHAALWAAALLRRSGVSLPLERAAPFLNRAASMLDRFGSERGGMLITVGGVGHDGSNLRVDWHITADANHGPEIPCMAAILLARKLARGQISKRGAFACMDFLDLAEFAPEFSRWKMQTGIDEIIG